MSKLHLREVIPNALHLVKTQKVVIRFGIKTDTDDGFAMLIDISRSEDPSFILRAKRLISGNNGARRKPITVSVHKCLLFHFKMTLVSESRGTSLFVITSLAFVS